MYSVLKDYIFVLKDFIRRCFVAQICADFGGHAHFGTYLLGPVKRRRKNRIGLSQRACSWFDMFHSDWIRMNKLNLSLYQLSSKCV